MIASNRIWQIAGLALIWALQFLSAPAATAKNVALTADECAVIFGNGPVVSEPMMSRLPQPQILFRPDGEGDLASFLRKAQSASAPVVGIAFDRAKQSYTLHSKGGNQSFGSHDIGKLVEILLEQTQNKTFYWVPDGFETQAKTAAFESSLRVQIARADPERRLRSVESIPESGGGGGGTRYSAVPELPQSFFAKGFEIKEVQKSQLTAGQYTGWFRILVKFVVRIKDEAQAFTVAILVKGEQVAEDALRRIGEMQRNRRPEISAATMVADIEFQLRRAHPKMKDTDISFLLQEEFSKSYLVERRDIRFAFG